MKQLIISQKKAYASGTTIKGTDLTTVPEGTLAFFSLKDSSLISTAPTTNFMVVCGAASDKMPICFPEVDVKTLTVTKSSYDAGATYTSAITVPTTEKGKVYTVIVAKKGVVFNERNRWTYTSMAKSTTAADVAKDIVAQINANSVTSGVSAAYTGGKITVTAKTKGDNYELIGADELMGVATTDTTAGKKPVLDKAYIQDLASRCAAGKGFNYLGGDGKEIYPSYPEVVDENQYILYTLRFAVPRVASKQRDEVVYQLLHIAVPVGSGAISTLDTMFGTGTSAS